MASRTAAPVPARSLPLVVTDDSDLLDALLDIAARAGVEIEVAPDPAGARPRYAAAPIVLVTLGSASACARAGLPRRPGVVLISRDETPEAPWSAAELLGAEHVALLPAAAPWLADRLAEARGHPGRETGKVVTVIGGRGGAGASVLAAGLAVTAARSGLRALLVDLDPLGGGIDLVLGWEGIDGVRWPALAQTSGPICPSALVEALPCRGDLAALSWDREESGSVPPEALVAALDAGRRDRQVVVADLPRHLDDAAVLALSAADRALLVVPAELRACAAATRMAARIAEYTDALALVVRGPGPGGIRAREISRAVGVPVLGTFRSEPDLARGLERGEPPAGAGAGPLATLCRALLSDLHVAGRAAA